MSESREYTVWVGAVEVNDYLLTKSGAEKLATTWEKDGYDDVVVERIAKQKTQQA